MATILEKNRTLRHTFLFAELADQDIAFLDKTCQWRNCHAGEVILDKGSLTREVYFILSGRVGMATYSPFGKEITLAVRKAGDFFGELAAIDDMPRSASAVAMEPCELAIMPQQIFIDLVKKNSDFCLRLMGRLAYLVRESGTRILELSTLPAAQRVYSTLLRMAQRDAAVPDLWVVRPLPSMRDLASLTSTTRETVSRALNQLYPSGLVKRKGQNFYIMDREKFEEVVQGLEAYNAKSDL